MKKRLLILAAAFVCMATACTKEAESFRGTEQKSSKPMTEYELKDALQQAAIDAFGNISLTSETDLIEVAAYYMVHYKDLSFDQAFMNKLSNIAQIKESIEYIEPVAAAAILNGMAAMLKAPAAMPMEHHTQNIIINASLLNITGIFRANEPSKEWKYTSCDDRLEFRFADGDSRLCILTIIPKGKGGKVKADSHSISQTTYDWEGDDDDYIYKDESTEDITINLPSSLKITLTADNKELASMNIRLGAEIRSTNEYDFEDRYVDYEWITDVDTSTVTLGIDKISFHSALKAGDYTIKGDVSAKSGKAEESIALYKGTKELLSEYVTTPYDFSNLNKVIENSNMEIATEVFGKVEGTAAIGPDVFVTAMIDLKQLTSISEAKTPQEAVEKMGNAEKFFIYYGETKWQARIIPVYNEEKNDIISMIEFADGTQYEIGDFFKTTDFARALTSVYGIAEDFNFKFQQAMDKAWGPVIM